MKIHNVIELQKLNIIEFLAKLDIIGSVYQRIYRQTHIASLGLATPQDITDISMYYSVHFSED